MFRKNYAERLLLCPACGKTNRIFIHGSHKRPDGHVKTMYCLYCGKLVDMKETYDPRYR